MLGGASECCHQLDAEAEYEQCLWADGAQVSKVEALRRLRQHQGWSDKQEVLPPTPSHWPPQQLTVELYPETQQIR